MFLFYFFNFCINIGEGTEEPLQTFNYTAVYKDSYSKIMNMFGIEEKEAIKQFYELNNNRDKCRDLIVYFRCDDVETKIGEQIIVPGTNPYPDSSIIEATGRNVFSKTQLWAIGWREFMNDTVYEDLQETLREFKITTTRRLRHFFTHTTYDSQNGEFTLEDTDGAEYENDGALGNTQEGDGLKYRGAGYLMMRGRKSFQEFADYVDDGEVMNQGAEYVAEQYPWKSAGFMWYNLGLNSLANDKDTTVSQVMDELSLDNTTLPDRELLFNLCERYIPAPGGDPTEWDFNAALIIGIVIAAVAIIAIVVYCFCKSKTAQNDVEMHVLV